MNFSILNLLMVTLGSNLINAFLTPEEIGEPFASVAKDTHEKCNLITGSGSDKDIADMRNGIFDDNNPDLKKYVLGIYVLTDVITTDVDFNEEAMAKVLPSDIKEKALKNYNYCFYDAKSKFNDPSEIAWGMKKCSYEKDPENFIVF
ncbi:hypothetical protein JTB14_031378 [Gonioctena quinquepunctata]|nr:hypothetical protein JTB14_031378 [Gonioctena quinquepunctata]